MKSQIAFFLLIVSLSLASAQIYDNCEIYGICADDVSISISTNQTVNGTINTSNSTLYWDTGDHGSLRNVDDILHNWLDSTSLLWSNAGHTIDANLDMNSYDINEVDDINAEGVITVVNEDPDSAAATLYYNDIGDQLDIGVRGSNYVNPTEVFGSTMGVRAHNSSLFLATGYNNTILIGSTPDDDDANLNFILKIDPVLQALVLQGNKYIRPVTVDGGSAMVFQSLEVLDAGGFPFVWVAQDSNNDTIVPQWIQNGNNNSYSGMMNSWGTVPKSWVEFSGDPLGNESQGMDFLFNVSDYIKYCDYLQTNLSLVPEGCKYFADTTGRLVPLLFGGDLEIHRTATIHEGATIFNNLDFIGRNGNDVNMIFNGALEYGKLHIQDQRQILANITDFERTICNFDDATLCDFYSESVAPEVGRDWASVDEVECHEDRCANAKGGNTKIMCISEGTQNAVNINISFWLTTSFLIGDELTVELDDNDGNVTSVFSETGAVDDTFNSFIMPSTYENKTNVTTCFILDGQNLIREAWVDIVEVTATFSPPQLINETYAGGRLIQGSDRDTLSCGIETYQRLNNDTLEPEWIMDVGCPDGVTRLLGNATFVDTIVENQTVIGDSLITGNLTVDGFISEGGMSIDEKYLKLDASNGPITGNLDIVGILNATSDSFINNSKICTADNGACPGTNVTTIPTTQHMFFDSGEETLGINASFMGSGFASTNYNDTMKIMYNQDVVVTGMSCFVENIDGSDVANFTLWVEGTAYDPITCSLQAANGDGNFCRISNADTTFVQASTFSVQFIESGTIGGHGGCSVEYYIEE